MRKPNDKKLCDDLGRHVRVVLEAFAADNVPPDARLKPGEWPDGSAFGDDDFEAYGAWCFVDGYATALGEPAEALLQSVGLLAPGVG